MARPETAAVDTGIPPVLKHVLYDLARRAVAAELPIYAVTHITTPRARRDYLCSLPSHRGGDGGGLDEVGVARGDRYLNVTYGFVRDDGRRRTIGTLRVCRPCVLAYIASLPAYRQRALAAEENPDAAAFSLDAAPDNA